MYTQERAVHDFGREPLGSFDDITADMAGPYLDDLRKLMKLVGDPLRIFTACSGTEALVMFLRKLGELAFDESAGPGSLSRLFRLVGSCEIEPHLARFIDRNFRPGQPFFIFFLSSWLIESKLLSLHCRCDL